MEASPKHVKNCLKVLGKSFKDEGKSFLPRTLGNHIKGWTLLGVQPRTQISKYDPVKP